MSDTRAAEWNAPAPIRCKYAGSGWIARNLERMKLPGLSPLGANTADILGETFRGIYHLSHTALFHKRTLWHHERCICITVSGELASHDCRELTDLVLLSHAFGIRLAISGASVGYLKLQFTGGAGMWMGTMPPVDRIGARFLEEYPPATPPHRAVEPPSQTKERE